MVVMACRAGVSSEREANFSLDNCFSEMNESLLEALVWTESYRASGQDDNVH